MQPEDAFRGGLEADSGPFLEGPNAVTISRDRIFSHKVVDFAYTSYDTRRAVDVINVGSSHKDVMLLAASIDSSGNHTGTQSAAAASAARLESAAPHRMKPFSAQAPPSLCITPPSSALLPPPLPVPVPSGLSAASTAARYRFARVLGVFHANVIYIGSGARHHRPQRVDFLWVRWFEYLEERPFSMRLPSLQIRPVDHKEAFGFIDPSLIIRGCHIVPAFAAGRRYPNGIGHSTLGQDADDWERYHVGM